MDNIFTDIKKATKGNGLKTPPPSKKNKTGIKAKEGGEAVPVNVPRSYRISTFIHAEYGNTLEDTIQKIRRETGRKPKIAEVIEMAIEKLNTE